MLKIRGFLIFTSFKSKKNPSNYHLSNGNQSDLLLVHLEVVNDKHASQILMQSQTLPLNTFFSTDQSVKCALCNAMVRYPLVWLLKMNSCIIVTIHRWNPVFWLSYHLLATDKIHYLVALDAIL